jgi:hypothetical protein
MAAVWMGIRARTSLENASPNRRQSTSPHTLTLPLPPDSPLSQNLYWIHPLTSTSFPVPDIEYYNLEPTIQGPPPPDLSFQPLGHVSLDWEDYGGDDSLTSREEAMVTIATFFVLHSQVSSNLISDAANTVLTLF